MDDINTTVLAISNIVVNNPVLNESEATKREYLKRLKRYVRAGEWHRRKYERAVLEAYERIVLAESKITEEHGIDYYGYYILFDLLHVLGYEGNCITEEKRYSVEEKYYKDFPGMRKNEKTVNEILSAFQGNDVEMERLAHHSSLIRERKYIQTVMENIAFLRQKPFSIMVTATMSAGKSTFINALTGKYISLSQNLACTSKIHSICNKAFEDNCSYEYDHELVMTAGRDELLNDNALNTSNKIIGSTHFRGFLGKCRVIVNDSPGVNFSGDKEHRLITDRLIKAHNYDLLIYLMNATQLGTNDEDEHLDYVKRTIGRKPVLFIVNKIDSFDIDEESVEAAVNKQIAYLEKKGFKAPVVCPISARAGYLSKQFMAEGLSRSEERELYNYIDKFEQMHLDRYYAKNFKHISIPNAKTEEEQLLKTCGLAYVEKIIKRLIKGGQSNGTVIR